MRPVSGNSESARRFDAKDDIPQDRRIMVKAVLSLRDLERRTSSNRRWRRDRDRPGRDHRNRHRILDDRRGGHSARILSRLFLLGLARMSFVLGGARPAENAVSKSGSGRARNRSIVHVSRALEHRRSSPGVSRLGGLGPARHARRSAAGHSTSDFNGSSTHTLRRTRAVDDGSIRTSSCFAGCVAFGVRVIW